MPIDVSIATVARVAAALGGRLSVTVLLARRRPRSAPRPASRRHRGTHGQRPPGRGMGRHAGGDLQRFRRARIHRHPRVPSGDRRVAGHRGQVGGPGPPGDARGARSEDPACTPTSLRDSAGGRHRSRGCWSSRTTGPLGAVSHEHEGTFATAFPTRTVAVKRWLRAPDGPIAGLVFLTDANQDGRRQCGGLARQPARRGCATLRRRCRAAELLTSANQSGRWQEPHANGQPGRPMAELGADPRLPPRRAAAAAPRPARTRNRGARADGPGSIDLRQNRRRRPRPP